VAKLTVTSLQKQTAASVPALFEKMQRGEAYGYFLFHSERISCRTRLFPLHFFR
jgi:hypothetical protein